MDQEFLKIGDQIALFSDQANGYLTSMGFNSPTIYLQVCSKLHNSHFQNLRSMIFQVVPRLQYDALKEWRREEKIVKQRNENPNSIPADESAQLFQRQNERWEILKRRLKHQDANNVAFMEECFGKKVLYGQQIQLMHVDSGYYLQHAKRVSELDRNCQLLELMKDPNPQRCTFVFSPRYNYRQEGEPIVLNDHVLIYNQKYNSYVHVSDHIIFAQEVRNFAPSDYRPESPKRRENPDQVYKRCQANMSQNFFKWEVIPYRQIASLADFNNYVYSGDVIYLRHAETSGALCQDEHSVANNRIGDPVYVRIYKGNDDDKVTTNCLFEIEIHSPYYSQASNQQGCFLNWKSINKGKGLVQTVRFRHLNSGKLLTIKPYKHGMEVIEELKKGPEELAEGGEAMGTDLKAEHEKLETKIKEEKKKEAFNLNEGKLILTLGENITTHDINQRINRIHDIEKANKYNINFNPLTHPEIQHLNRGIGMEQVFQIENTILEPVNLVKKQSVIKIKNLKYNMYISTELKKLDGDADEQGDDGGGGDNNGGEGQDQTQDLMGLADESQLATTQMGGASGAPAAENSQIDASGPNLQMDTSNIGASALQGDNSAGLLGQGEGEGLQVPDAPPEEVPEEEMQEEEVAEGEGEEEEEVAMGGKFAKIMVDENDSIIVNMTKLVYNGTMDDVYIIEKYPVQEVRNILFIQSSVPKIKEFVFSLRQDQDKIKSPYLKSIEELLSKMVFFTTQTESRDPYTCEGVPVKSNQKYMRELKIIDMLIDILIYPFEGEQPLYCLADLTQKSPIVKICQLIYRLLKHCAKDNEYNKFYVAQWISHFFDQSMATVESNNLKAELTIEELLENNKQLLDKQINSTTIKKIVQNCSDNPKSERSINLLSALCQCNGEQIASNQDDVCEFLLDEEEFQHLLLKVESNNGQHYVIFSDDKEILQRNKGRPLKLKIELMESYFTKMRDMRLFSYFESMINLISLMGLGRNYRGINHLAELYTAEMTMDCFLNPNIPYKMRSNFAKLLITIHIDKDPLEKLVVPVLTRTWNEILQEKTDMPKSKVMIQPLLLKLKDFVKGYFESMKGVQRSFDQEQNQFTYQCIIIVDKMVQLGFYSNEKELLSILEPMISLLDGSNDFTSKEEEQSFLKFQEQQEKNSMGLDGKKKKSTAEPFKRNKTERYKNSENNVLIFSIKKKIIEVLSRIMDMQNDIRLTKFLMDFNRSDKEMGKDPNVSGKELRYLESLLKGTSLSNAEEEQIEQTKQQCDEKVINWMKKSYLAKNLDMREMSTKKDLICVLLDIILYQDSKLVNNAFTLLSKYFQQKQMIIKYAKDVQILQDQQEVTILNKVSFELREMKNEAENSEFWIGINEKSKLTQSRNFIDKLEFLTDLCVYKPNRVIDFDDKKKKKDEEEEEDEKKDEFEFLNLTELQQEWDNEDPKICSDEEINDEKNQRLLRNLQAYEVPITIIKQQGLEGAEDKNCFLKVLEKCYIFLIKFVRNNKENQFILIDYLQLFMDDMEFGVHAWELIAEIFKNCELLVNYNFFPLIKKVIKLIDNLPKETQKKTTMLSFLSYFIKYNGVCLKEVQQLICMEITSVVRKNCDHLFVGELGLKDLHLYILEMKNAYSEFKNDARYVQEIHIPPELSYTIEYIKLIGFTGEGKNSATETRAQEKLPIQDILENLKLADFCYPLKSALVYFMDSIYFDIEKDVSEDNIAKMFDFLKIVHEDLTKFIEIQLRMKQSKGQQAKPGGKRPNENQNGEEDLDEIQVDINKNFTIMTSFGSFTICYLIERYIFENLFLALTHFFHLNLPIKPDQTEFYEEFLKLILKATNFVVKDLHKDFARELFKKIKQIPQLKKLGGDDMHCKHLVQEGAEKKAKPGQMINIPQLSQAQKLNAYMQSVSTNKQLTDEFEKEFSELVQQITQIDEKTKIAFEGSNTINVKDIVSALIKVSGVESDIDKNLRIVCLKIIRKVVELVNKQAQQQPAIEWESQDWANFAVEIKQQQTMLNDLGAINLICDLVAYEQKLSIKEEALLVSVAILLGGNNESQLRFNNYITNDSQNVFMLKLKELIDDSFAVIQTTQTKRNDDKMKQIQLQKRYDELNELSGAQKRKKHIADEIKKLKLDLSMIEDDISKTEFDRNENPALYTTDALTIARAINNYRKGLKLHQLFCENHNLVLQNTLRQQCNPDGKPKQQSFDFPTYYSKMLEEFQKIFNNNTSDLGHQLIETLTESIQGPCKLNQKALVNAKILDSSREYIAGFQESDVAHLGFEGEDLESLGEFKQKIITMLTSLLEGEIDIDIMNRMAFSLDFFVMKDRMLTVFTQFAEEILDESNIDMRDLSLNKLTKRLKKDSFEGTVSEAFEIYILMHSLADSNEEAKQNIERKSFTKEQLKAFEFIQLNIGRIEVIVDGNLQRVYFPIRPVCGYMSIGARKELMVNIDRETQATKVKDLMDAVPNLIDEMNHNEELSRAILQITPARLNGLKDFSTMVGLSINFLYLCFARRKYHYRTLDIDQWVIDTIQILGYIQGSSSGILIFFYAINKKRLITKKMWRTFVEEQNSYEDNKLIPNNNRLDVEEMSYEMTHQILMLKGPEASEFNLTPEQNFGNWFCYLEFQIYNIFFFIHDSTFQYYVLYFGISILGYLSSDIYYSLHLLDVITRSPTLQNVIKSVTQNMEQLGLTLALLVIIVYIYTSITFFYIQDNMYDWGVNAYDSDIVGENNCITMAQCFVTMLDKGLRFGGGIGDVTEPIHYLNATEKYFFKLVHDASFHIVVKVILLNVLFGIIIDTFAQMRDEEATRLNDKVNVCFICNFDRMTFDKTGGLQKHITDDHNLWNYVYYMVHLYSKDRSDHTGVESFILEKFKQGEQGWMPRQKALCLLDVTEGEGESESSSELAKQTMKLWLRQLNDVDACLGELLDMIRKKKEEKNQKEEEDKIKNKA